MGLRGVPEEREGEEETCLKNSWPKLPRVVESYKSRSSVTPDPRNRKKTRQGWETEQSVQDLSLAPRTHVLKSETRWN